MIVKIPENIRRRRISWLNMDKEIMDYLKENDFKTVRDVIRRQDEIPQEIHDKLKIRIISEAFGIKR